MRIAIVGSGMVGVSCARALHRFGHEVEIFEVLSKDSPTRPRQMEGSVHFLDNVPELHPDQKMKALEIHSPSHTILLKGKLGYFYEVGGETGIEARERRIIEESIPINYSKRVEKKEQLEDQFDVVVAADGYRSRIALEAGLRSKTPTQVGIGVGFTVEGDFNPECMTIWFNNQLSLHGYTYIIPFSTTEASLVSASIDQNVPVKTFRKNLKQLAVQRGWQILDEWVDFESWYTFSSYQKDNLFVVGNAGSFVDPALGFGLKWGLKSAELCAEAIHKNLDYNLLLEDELLPEFGSSQVLRKFFESASDQDYDRFVESFRNPLVRTLVQSGNPIFQKLARTLLLYRVNQLSKRPLR
ncbi:NAD(P)/FAD-dependent oxidoreductase [Candidatus Bathyarchaeota archaeon]|nr:NAD(P)/FAD-dependent oxidoreductase [Candidatus Bathyarchaeota archaeon]